MSKPLPDKKYRKFISEHECVNARREGFEYCTRFDYIDQYGDPRSTCSHVKTWASSFQDHGNCVPHCLACHRRYEDGLHTSEDRVRYKIIAEALLEDYIDMGLLEMGYDYVN